MQSCLTFSPRLLAPASPWLVQCWSGDGTKMKWFGLGIKMKVFQYLIFYSSLWFYSLSLLGIPNSEKPNILLITADDLNWNSLGCMGNKLKGLSPNLDRLASEGLLIKHGYVATRFVDLPAKPFTPGSFPKAMVLWGMGFNLQNGGNQPEQMLEPSRSPPSC